MVAAGALGRILHIDRLTTVFHQRGHSLPLGLGAAVAIGIRHILPVEAHGRQRIVVPCLLFILEGGLLIVSGNLLTGRLRPPVIVHHLCHRRRHTARHTAFAFPIRIGTIIERTLVIIWTQLIPFGLDQRLDGGLRGPRLLFSSLENAVHEVLKHAVREILRASERLYRTVILLQPGAHIVWHLLPVDRTAVGIAQHRQRPTVARSNHEATAVDIECIDTLRLHLGRLQPRRIHRQSTGLQRAVGSHILQSTVPGLLLRNGLAKGHDGCHRKDDDGE